MSLRLKVLPYLLYLYGISIKDSTKMGKTLFYRDTPIKVSSDKILIKQKPPGVPVNA